MGKPHTNNPFVFSTQTVLSTQTFVLSTQTDSRVDKLHELLWTYTDRSAAYVLVHHTKLPYTCPVHRLQITHIHPEYLCMYLFVRKSQHAFIIQMEPGDQYLDKCMVSVMCSAAHVLIAT